MCRREKTAWAAVLILAATATIVWIRYRNYGLEPDKSTAHVMVGAILSDTGNFQSSTTTFADRATVKALSALAGISDIDAFYRDMYKARISYEGMTDEEIFFKDYKEYETRGTKYAVGCVEVYDEKEARDMSDRMKKIIPSALASAGMDMSFAQVNIFHDGISVTCLVPSGEHAATILSRDAVMPYDRRGVRQLKALAEKEDIPYRIDAYQNYGSDASVCVRSGKDIRALCFGPGAEATHNYERTHRDSVKASLQLLKAYLLSRLAE